MTARSQRLVAVPALACALAAAAPAGAAEPDLIGALRENGAEVVSLGSRGRLHGYFVTPAKGAGYGLYLTEDGHAVAGLLYGPDGTEITGAQLAAAHDGGVPDADAGATVTAHAADEVPGAPTSPDALFERSAAAFGFTLGERGPLAVLLGDPACPWSRSAAARLGREALAGRLRLRIVPVAVLGADAARRAAAIAASADPGRAWFAGPDGRADRTGAERIARNNALLDAWGASAVPLITWRARDGARHRIGDVDDVGAWLREAGFE